MLDDNTVSQRDEKVVKLYHENDVESRLSALESNIEDIKQLLFENNSWFNPQSTKEVENEAPESGFEPESEPRQLRDVVYRFKALNNIISDVQLNSSHKETLATLEFS